MKATAVVEGGVLEDQATEVAVSSHDVVRLFFLAEFVAVVLGLAFGGFTHQGGVHPHGERHSLEIHRSFLSCALAGQEAFIHTISFLDLK